MAVTVLLGALSSLTWFIQFTPSFSWLKQTIIKHASSWLGQKFTSSHYGKTAYRPGDFQCSVPTIELWQDQKRMSATFLLSCYSVFFTRLGYLMLIQFAEYSGSAEMISTEGVTILEIGTLFKLSDRVFSLLEQIQR